MFSISVVIVFFILLFIFTGDDPRALYDFEYWYEFLPLLFGLIMFGPSLDMVDKTGQKEYYSLGIFSTILGLIVVVMNFQVPKEGFTIYLLILGVTSCIVGVLSFIRFVKKYPIIEETEPQNIQEDKDEF